MYALDQEQSGMSTMLIRDTEKFRITTSIQFGIPYTYIMASITRKFNEVSDTKDFENKSNKNSNHPVKLRGAIK